MMGPGGSTHTHGGLCPPRAVGHVTGLSVAGVPQRIQPSESLRATTKGSERPVTRSMQGTGKWGEQSLRTIVRVHVLNELTIVNQPGVIQH